MRTREQVERDIDWAERWQVNYRQHPMLQTRITELRAELDSIKQKESGNA
jgi:hypothetical protein